MLRVPGATIDSRLAFVYLGDEPGDRRVLLYSERPPPMWKAPSSWLRHTPLLTCTLTANSPQHPKGPSGPSSAPPPPEEVFYEDACEHAYEEDDVANEFGAECMDANEEVDERLEDPRALARPRAPGASSSGGRSGGDPFIPALYARVEGAMGVDVAAIAQPVRGGYNVCTTLDEARDIAALMSLALVVVVGPTDGEERTIDVCLECEGNSVV